MAQRLRDDEAYVPFPFTGGRTKKIPRSRYRSTLFNSQKRELKARTQTFRAKNDRSLFVIVIEAGMKGTDRSGGSFVRTSPSPPPEIISPFLLSRGPEHGNSVIRSSWWGGLLSLRLVSDSDRSAAEDTAIMRILPRLIPPIHGYRAVKDISRIFYHLAARIRRRDDTVA